MVNVTSSNVNNIRVVAIVHDDSANATGPAATTAAGSISGSFEEQSAVAGDKTVRRAYTDGIFEMTFTAIAQSDVGKTVYAINNSDCDETQIAGMKIGTLTAYISATKGWVELNKYYSQDGYVMARGALTAVTGTTAGGVLSWANPTGETIFVEDLIIDVTTKSTSAATCDIGVAANGTTSSDTIYDALDVGTAAVIASSTMGLGGLMVN